ncbi:Uncharacterised protein [Staphylococcus piscifermentans]|uniref:Lipoprotein n=1 Tax=Staphylococcus piscifermentans TaxID=70258 RepID=A0A239TF17_9STAP|nr:DUF5004 domain-containing protein [Staphylococcus piscifermentans]RTX85161.1 hypothetical protein CD139_04705 [Staphylococcus piscifermentans]GEP83639.1 hypothetical protein SPI02_02240 [Staphylococcus piscifermentans]SNU96270.1 Uncharacterised protein [Staphylococcus piscifermentans]
MRKIWLLSMLLVVLLVGCGKNEEYKFLKGSWKNTSLRTGDNNYLVFKDNGIMKQFSDKDFSYKYKKENKYTIERSNGKDKFIVKEEAPNMVMESTFKKIDKNTIRREYVKLSSGHLSHEGTDSEVFYRLKKKHWWNFFD